MIQFKSATLAKQNPIVHQNHRAAAVVGAGLVKAGYCSASTSAGLALTRC